MLLQLQYVINTHVHADHVTSSGEIKKRLNVKTNGNESNVIKSVISRMSGASADMHVNENDEISCGEAIRLKVIATPGEGDYKRECYRLGHADVV